MVDVVNQILASKDPVEQGPVEQVLSNPQTGYTSRLVRAAFEIAA